MAPSQPPVAPAKREHDNNDNKQAQRAVAGLVGHPGGGLGCVFVILAKVHWSIFLDQFVPGEVLRAIKQSSRPAGRLWFTLDER
jgi:hypothetical protein